MIADRRSQIADRNKVCDRLRSYGNYFCDRLRSCDRDRRQSQKIEPCSISCDRLRSIAIVSAICDLRSYGNQPLDRTWFYLLRSSAITIAEVVSIWSQTIADLIAICDLRSAIIWKPALSMVYTKKEMEYNKRKQFRSVQFKNTNEFSIKKNIPTWTPLSVVLQHECYHKA